MLGKRMSSEKIAENLNAKKVAAIHGTNRWTAASVRKAFGVLGLKTALEAPGRQRKTSA
jgi:hypothetical protein